MRPFNTACTGGIGSRSYSGLAPGTLPALAQAGTRALVVVVVVAVVAVVVG